MSGSSPGQQRRFEREHNPTTHSVAHGNPRDHQLSHFVEDLSHTLESPADEGILTCCKRVKTSHTDQKRQQSNVIEADGYSVVDLTGNIELDPSTDEAPRKQNIVTTIFQGAQGWLTGRGWYHPSSSISDRGVTHEALLITNPPNKTMGRPGIGGFKPTNGLGRNDKKASAPARPAQRKPFNLSEDYAQDSKFVRDTLEENLRGPKRQKTGPEKSATRKSSSEDEDPYELSNNHPRSPVDSSAISKSVQSLGSQRQQVNLNKFGMVQEYHNVEAMVGFGNSNKKKERIVKMASSQIRNETENRDLRSRSSHFDATFDLDGNDDSQEKSAPTSRYQGNANFGPARDRYRQRPPSAYDDLDGISRYSTTDKSKQPGKGTNRTGANLTHHSTGNLFGRLEVRVGSIEDSNDDAESIDPLAEGHEFAIQRSRGDQNASGIAGQAGRLHVSESVVIKGDIPRSKFAKIQKNVYGAVYVQAGPWLWSAEVTPEERFEFRMNEKTREFEPYCNGRLLEESTGLHLKPRKINKVLYHDDSPKVQIFRAVEKRFANKVHIELNGHASGHFVRALQSLNSQIIAKVVEKFDFLDKAFAKDAKDNDEFTERQRRKPADMSLLEANQARRHEAQAPAQVKLKSKELKNNVSSTIIQLANTRQRHSSKTIDSPPHSSQSLKSRMRKEAESSSKEIQTTHNLNSAPQGIESLPDTDRLFQNTKPETRSAARNQMGRQKPPRSPSPTRWTEQNPNWKNEHAWTSSLIYPPDVKKKTTVDLDDIRRLDDGEFLNDNLIEFYLRYLEHGLQRDHPELGKRIYFQNTFFYEALTKKVRNNNINYGAVKRWTAKIDLFEYDYIIVPVNERMHWYLAIICNAPKLVQFDCQDAKGLQEAGNLAKNKTITIEVEHQHDLNKIEQVNALRKEVSSESMSQKVEHLSLEDSSETAGQRPESEPSSKSVPCNSKEADAGQENAEISEVIPTSLAPSAEVAKRSSQGRKLKRKSSVRKYDIDDARIITLDSLGSPHSPACSNLREYLACEAKERRGVDISVDRLGMTAKNVPQQPNFYDCGVFVLGYVEKFLEDPDRFVRLILHGEMDVQRDWPGMKASRIRTQIRDLLFHLQLEQIDREREQRKTKKAAKLAGKGDGLKGDLATSSHVSSSVESSSLIPDIATEANLSENNGRRHGSVHVTRGNGAIENHTVSSSSNTTNMEESLSEADRDDLKMSKGSAKSSSKARHTTIPLESPLNPAKLSGRNTTSLSLSSPLKSWSTPGEIFQRFAKKSSDIEVESKVSNQVGSRSSPLIVDDTFDGIQYPQKDASNERTIKPSEMHDSLDDGVHAQKTSPLLSSSREESFEDILATPERILTPHHTSRQRLNTPLRTPTTVTPMATRTSPRQNRPNQQQRQQQQVILSPDIWLKDGQHRERGKQ